MPTPRPRATAAPIALAIEVLAPARQQFVAAIGVFAALVAAGAGGLIGHSLRHAIVLLALLAILAAAFPRGAGSLPRIGMLLVSFLLSVFLASSDSMIVSSLGVLVMLCGVTLVHPVSQPALRPLLFALLVLALYRLAHDSIPTFWQLADIAGWWIGRVGEKLAGQPLSVGATFAGVDSLVLMLAFAAAWVAQSPPPRLGGALLLFASILGVHLLYLFILASLRADSPLVPWNVPIIAPILDSILIVFVMRWSVIDPDRARPITTAPIIASAMALLALALPAVAMLCWAPIDLKGKKVVFYKEGFLNWMKPEWGEYGRFSQGMYGLIGRPIGETEAGKSRFLELYGATATVSEELSDADLATADALVLLYPDKPWKEGQRERIAKYVAGGGTLLLFGEHTICDRKSEPEPKLARWPNEANARFNDLLQETQMRVPFDSAVFAVGGWLQSYETLAHPITMGISDDRNQFGVVIGASIEARWPSRPIIIGKFGFGEPGDEGRFDHAMLGDEKFQPGEHLGDVVLAAEQNVGKGRVVLFGDTSMMSNGLLHGCHDSNARLLAYVTNRNGTPQAIGRQIAAAVLALLLLVLVILQAHPLRIAACGLLMAASISLSTRMSHDNASMIPGQQTDPKKSNLVYIDTSHMEATSLESWREQGLMGLQLAWVRSGYMPLALHELTSERLSRAAVLVSAAPAKPFSDGERAAIREFVNNGGIFICTAGWDRSQASRAILNDFGLYVGSKRGETPEPLGWFKSPFMDLGSYKPHVRFWAAWPVASDRPDAKPIAYGGKDQAVILVQPVGNKKGKVVLIGDTEFAMNKNLEHEGGEPFEGMRENADFWRWFIDYLTDKEQPWTPAAPATQPAAQPASEVTP